MKLIKAKNFFGNKYQKKYYTRNSLNEFSNTQNHPNFYISKIIDNNPKIKNESLIKDNIPNVTKSIQNIFANEEKKEKAFQYLFKKSKENNIYNSTYIKKVSNSSITPEMKKSQKFLVVGAYNNKNNNFKPIMVSNDTSKSYTNIIPSKKYIKRNFRYSASAKFLSKDEPLNENEIINENNFYHSNFKNFPNLTSSKYSNRNKRNKLPNLSYTNTIINSPNNGYMTQRNKNISNFTHDILNDNKTRNTINTSDKHNNVLNNNPYKEFLKISFFSYDKNNMLKYGKEKIIDISNNDNNKDNDIKIIQKNNCNKEGTFNKTNSCIKKIRNSRTYLQDINSYKKKSPINSRFNLINNKTSRKFYNYKKSEYKNLDQKNLFKDKLNIDSNKIIKENNDKNENKIIKDETRYYNKKYEYRSINSNTIENRTKFPKLKPKNFKKNNNNGNDIIQEEPVQKNENEVLKKNNPNSPLNTIRVNKYSNKDFFSRNIKIKNIEKGNTYQRSPRQYLNGKINYYNKKEIGNNNDNDIKRSLFKNKYIFNDEEEIIDFIKKKYNKRKVEEIFNKEDNGMVINDYQKENNKKYFGLMTTEEGNKIKQKNEQLSSKIKYLINENKIYKKELNEMKNKFNDLSREIINIKEKNF